MEPFILINFLEIIKVSFFTSKDRRTGKRKHIIFVIQIGKLRLQLTAITITIYLIIFHTVLCHVGISPVRQHGHGDLTQTHPGIQ